MFGTPDSLRLMKMSFLESPDLIAPVIPASKRGYNPKPTDKKSVSRSMNYICDIL